MQLPTRLTRSNWQSVWLLMHGAPSRAIVHRQCSVILPLCKSKGVSVVVNDSFTIVGPAMLVEDIDVVWLLHCTVCGRVPRSITLSWRQLHHAASSGESVCLVCVVGRRDRLMSAWRSVDRYRPHTQASDSLTGCHHQQQRQQQCGRRALDSVWLRRYLTLSCCHPHISDWDSFTSKTPLTQLYQLSSPIQTLHVVGPH